MLLWISLNVFNSRWHWVYHIESAYKTKVVSIEIAIYNCWLILIPNQIKGSKQFRNTIYEMKKKSYTLSNTIDIVLDIFWYVNSLLEISMGTQLASCHEASNRVEEQHVRVPISEDINQNPRPQRCLLSRWLHCHSTRQCVFIGQQSPLTWLSEL